MKSKTKTSIWIINEGKINKASDYLTTEEPLEIRLIAPKQTLAVTMRTPGSDFELAAGFLYSEGIIKHREDISKISYCIGENQQQDLNIINIVLKSGLSPQLQSLERHFFISSACGVCGKTSIEALKIRHSPVSSNQIQVSPELIYTLPDKLAVAQGIFTVTGGLHAAALFNAQGELLKVREDIGRHNALDKLIGSAFLAGELPLSNHIVMVSGRSSFEILQKSIAAGVPIVCAVSAPSSLAVSLALEFNVTLIGFLRGKRFNVYSGCSRLLF